jgi:uncharacterized protein (TIGR02246 family)
MNATSPALSGNDAILDLCARLSDAWDRNDAGAYAALFTRDSDYVAFDGSRLIGRAANEAHHAALFETVLKDSRLVFDGADLRYVGNDVALLHTTGTVLLPWQKQARNRRSIQTMVLVREMGAWRIAAFHNSRIRPVPAPDSLALRVATFFMRLRTVLAGRRAHIG